MVKLFSLTFVGINIIQRGGTVLYTARCLEFKEKAGVMKAKEGVRK